MNLYNVLLNNKISFVLHESGDSENVIYCKSFSDYLFNVGTFTTRTKEVILEYVVDNAEKYVVADVTFDNGECYRDVRFKVVVNENTETPYSTINLNLLNNKTQVAIPQQSQQIVEDVEELVERPAPVYISAPIIEAPDYTETINETLKLQKKLNVEKEEIRKQKIVLEKQNLLNKKLQEYKQELLEEYVTAVDKQKQLLGAHLKETLTIAEHDLSERITNTFNEYSNQLEIYQNKSKADQLEFIIEKINDSIVDIKVDLNSLVSNKFNQEQDILLEALHAKSQLLQEKYEQKLLLELEKYKETLFEEFRLSSQEAIVQTLAQKKDLTEQQIIIAFDNKEKEFNSHFEARIKNTTLELDSIVQEFSNKLPVISDDISLLETKLKDLLEERKKSDETGKFNTSQQKYITDTAQYWARRILDLGGGGGSVAVQYANGGTMNGDLNVNANYLSGGVNLLDIFALQPDLDHQTLSFNESTAQLSISNGNTVSLSALSGEFTDRLVNGSYQVVLSGNGNLTLPRAIVTASNSKLDLVGFGPNTAYLTTTADDSTALFMGAAVAELRANTYVSITTNTGGTPHLWEFGTGGGLKFPDNTTQTTAFTGNPDSSSWDSTYTTVKNFSASWEESADIGAVADRVTNIQQVTGSWQRTYTNVSTNSANWSDVYTTVKNFSASWEESADIGAVSERVTTIQQVTGSWQRTYTDVSTNSANWQTGYNNAIYTVNGTVNQIISTPAGSNTGNNSVTLSLPSNLIVPNNLTVLGNLTALGTSTFTNTIFTTTSALSVVNLGPGPALYVFQAAGASDVASFYDGDGIEVLHVGNAQGGGNPLGQVGINTSDPSAELTVNGAISGNKAITVSGGNSNQWNTAYTNLVSNSSNYLSGASVSYVNTNFVKLSGDTMTGTLSAPKIVLTSAGSSSSPAIILSGTSFNSGIYLTGDGDGININTRNNYTNLSITSQGVFSDRVIGTTSDGSAASPSVFVGYETNSGLFRPAANNIGISIAGTERVRVNNSGLTVTGSVSATQGSVFAPSTFTAADTVTDAALIMDFTRGASTGGMYVRRSNGQQRSIFNYQDSASNIDVGTFSNNINSVSIKAGGGNLTGFINFGTHSTNNAMRIIDSGNIGIGTITPNERLTVVGNISATGVIYVSGGNSNQWNSNYSTTQSNSANWSDVYTTVRNFSASWEESADIGAVADRVTNIQQITGSWQRTYTDVSTNSANWSDVYTTVRNFSASWEESADILPTVTNYLSTNNVLLSGLTVTQNLSVGGTIFTAVTAKAIATYIANIGNGVGTSFNLPHNLNTLEIITSVYDNTTNVQAYPTVTVVDANTVNVQFSFTPSTNAYRVVIVAATSTNLIAAYGGLTTTAVEKYQFRSSDFSITSSAYFAVDTTSGPVRATLPAAPSLGDTVIFIDTYKTWTASNLVLQRNGNVIESLAEDLSANISGFTFKATWVGAPAGWRIY